MAVHDPAQPVPQHPPKAQARGGGPEGLIAASLSCPPEQSGRLDFQDLRRSLAKLPVEQREAVLLVGAEGLSYEEAASLCGVAVGTIKSRVNRARTRLADLMAVQDAEDIGADRVTRATLSVN